MCICLCQENKELLGVVGTDVALPQLEDSIPGSEVNGTTWFS